MELIYTARVTKAGNAVVFLPNQHIDTDFGVLTVIDDSLQGLPTLYISDLGGKTPEQFVADHPEITIELREVAPADDGTKRYRVVGQK